MVASLGAWCDFLTEDEYRHQLLDQRSRTDEAEQAVEQFKRGVSFCVHEFAVLTGGRRVTLHDEQGFSMVVSVNNQSAPGDPWHSLTLEATESDVRTTVLPDDDDSDEHPWEWLARCLRAKDFDTTAAELRVLPYDVEFSQRLRARVVADT